MRYTLRPRLRIVGENGTIVMGPGKADLLDAIGRTGSIRAAAEELEMSYMRAWTLVRVMNAAFRSPLVEKERGGSAQGGAGGGEGVGEVAEGVAVGRGAGTAPDQPAGRRCSHASERRRLGG